MGRTRCATYHYLAASPALSAHRPIGSRLVGRHGDRAAVRHAVGQPVESDRVCLSANAVDHVSEYSGGQFIGGPIDRRIRICRHRKARGHRNPFAWQNRIRSSRHCPARCRTPYRGAQRDDGVRSRGLSCAQAWRARQADRARDRRASIAPSAGPRPIRHRHRTERGQAIRLSRWRCMGPPRIVRTRCGMVGA